MSKKNTAAEGITEDTDTEGMGGLVATEENSGSTGKKTVSPEGVRRVKCTIRNQTGEVGKQPVFVRMLTEHGAYEAYIPRETAVEIPEYVYDFLIASDGYELVAEQVNGRTEMVQKPVNRFIVQKG